MQVTIQAVGDEQTITKGKRSWQEVEVSYTGAKGAQTRKLKSFEGAVFDQVKALKTGDVVEVDVKKEGDFWNWKNIAPASAEQAKGGATSGGKVKAGDWETADERAKKQVYIVRQSSLANAIALNPKGSVGDVIKVAEQFTQWVLNGSSANPAASAGQEPE